MNTSSFVKTLLLWTVLTIVFLLIASYFFMSSLIGLPMGDTLYCIGVMTFGFVILTIVQFVGINSIFIAPFGRLQEYLEATVKQKKTSEIDDNSYGELKGFALALKQCLEALTTRENKALEHDQATQKQLNQVESQYKQLQEHEDASGKLLEALQTAAGQAQTASRHVFDSVSDLSTEVEKVHSGMQTQTDRMIETATAMEQMHMTVMDVAKNAASAATNAQASREKAQTGAQNVKDAVQSFVSIEKRILGLKETMDKLGTQAESIGEVLRVINDIADQTNLLALNAAIEAARAGEAGRGFAVVADEVRKLAEKTMTATQEVEGAIASIQNVARLNVEAVDETAQNITSSTAAATKAGEFMEEIVALIQETSIQVETIAAAAEEQSATSDQIANAVAEVSNVAEQTSIGMGRSADTLARMTGLVGELDAVVQSMSATKNTNTNTKLELGSGQLMQWSSELSVGINSIDQQHKRLVDLINQLNDAMKQKLSKSTLLHTINELKQYTVEHFAKEEVLFKKYSYPETESHQRIHAIFVDKVKKFEEDVSAGRVTVSMSIMTFLKDWLIKHIMGTDKKYAPFLLSKGVR